MNFKGILPSTPALQLQVPFLRRASYRFCMEPFVLIFSICLVSFTCYSQEKKICITVDDLPAVTYGVQGIEFKKELTEALVSTFTENQVPAIGYVNEGKLYKKGSLDSSRVHLLKRWLEGGLELGNHTYSHMDYHRVSFEDYTEDILKGEVVLKGLVKAYGAELRYFRHPYLRNGLRKSHADSLSVFLEQKGYIEAPVTIDNEEYLFAFAYSRAYKKKEEELMQKIGRDYVKYMEQKLLYFETQAQKLFKRDIDQILLIHANLLNATYMGELVKMYREHGYTFASQTEVLKDPAYEEAVTKFGDWGISWLDRWALSRGHGGEFFKEDPPTPEYIKELTRQR